MIETRDPITNQKFLDGVAVGVDPASAPDGTVVGYYDKGLPATATALFTGKTHTFIELSVAQRANAGSAAQYAEIFVVFNSADAATDLANMALVLPMRIENGRGQTKRKEFAAGTLASCHFLNSGVTTDDLVISAQCK